MPNEAQNTQTRQTLEKRRSGVLDECPTSYRSKFVSAYAGKSRKAAISATCLRCVGYVKSDITHCTAYACPLYEFRPYQSGDDDGQ